MLEPTPKAVLLGVQLPEVDDASEEGSLDELARLAKTLGLVVIGRVVQRRPVLDKGTVVGGGKLQELAWYTNGRGFVPSGAIAKEKKQPYKGGGPPPAEPLPPLTLVPDPDAPAPVFEPATIVVVDHDLSPSQVRNLERATGAEVLDRTSIILAIFQRHARTREAKLEVEIARLEYLTPRLRETGGGRDRQRGGIGGRGAGESSLELDRRKVRDRIAELRRELATIDRGAKVRRGRRADQRTCALVGYTNAGKSSLMRALTAQDVYVADKLFATLGTTVRALEGVTPKILVSDTVGFIKKLPHSLVASFRATLDEAAEARLVFHVVDASDPVFREHMAVTNELLADIEADSPRILLFNKRDRLSPEVQLELRKEFPDAVLVSAHDPEDVRRVRDLVAAFFERHAVEAELLVPYARMSLLPEIYEHGRVLSETHDEVGARLVVRADAHVIERLELRLSEES